MSKELANLVFPNIDKTPEYYEELYPKRNLEEGAVVTRFAPSPTGFIHIGSLFTANFFVNIVNPKYVNDESLIENTIKLLFAYLTNE